jgi:uracil-DNA glycosylase
MIDRNDIITNAQTGNGPCAGCPAHKATQGWCVNPGLSNFSGKLIFVTQEPSHDIKSEDHRPYSKYNELYTKKFINWPGGKYIQKHYLDPLNLSIFDVWIADSLKCRLYKGDRRLFNEKAAFKHCRKYLKEEFESVNPLSIVTLGRTATQRTLSVLEIPENIIKGIKITKDYGLLKYETKWPVIIALHWGRPIEFFGLNYKDYYPVIQKALKDQIAGNKRLRF